MPVEHAIWKIGEKPVPLAVGKLASEQKLEEMIVKAPSILSGEWMLIGRQEITSHGGRIDLLAIAPDSSLILIELKRDRTPREIVAQTLDYASWVEQLTPERIAQIYQRFSDNGNLDEAFQRRFGIPLDEETLNGSHQLIIVAAELDDATERIIGYLNARNIAINAVFFRVFEIGEEQLLSRVWLIDPGETQVNVITPVGEKEPWNGEFYVSYGPTKYRDWEDARRYGFISAGGGSWYSQTLKLLSPGDRVWVKIPKSGYVGVGRVTESVRRVDDFTVNTEAGEQPALSVLKCTDHYKPEADNPAMAEYFVRVAWLDTVPEAQAVNEVGLFGNQNSVCQPTTPKWRHTVDRLKKYFPKWDDSAGRSDIS
jgi:hypothetical protein